MKKRGFTLIELLIVIGIIGILVGIGTMSIKKQTESRGMLIVTNEIGDFFRVAAKRSLEIGEKYSVDFDFEEKNIEIYRMEDSDGEWDDSGTRTTIEELELPTIFEYERISGSTGTQVFTNGITATGNMSSTTTIYVFESNSEDGIQDDQIAKYAVRLLTTDKHIKFLHVKEYSPKSEVQSSEIKDGTKGASKTTYWENIRGQ